MLGRLFRAGAAACRHAGSRWRGVSGPFTTLAARTGQQQGSRAGAGLSTGHDRAVWSVLLRLFHGGKGKDGTVLRTPPPVNARNKSGVEASMARTREIDRLGEARDVQGLLRIASEHVHLYDAYNCGTWLSRWSRLGGQYLQGEAPGEVLAVLERALQLLRSGGKGVDARFVSNLTNSLSKQEYGGEGSRRRDEVLGAVSGWCEEAGFEGFNALDLANVVNGFAKLGYEPDKEVLQALAAECSERGFKGFTPQNMANVVNGFAKLGHHPGKKVLQALALECSNRRFEGFTPQCMANVINGFARLGYKPDKEVLQALALACDSRSFKNFKPQEMANVLNGFAKLDHDPGQKVLEALAVECGKRGFKAFKPQEMANVLNGFAKLSHYPGEAMLTALASECGRRGFKSFMPQEMSNVLNGFAKLGHHPGKKVLQALAFECGQRGFEGFNPQDMANVLNGFAKLGHHPGKEVLEALAFECGQSGFKSFKPQEMANVVNGFAKLDHYPGEAVLGALVLECGRRGFEGFNAQEMANMVHGLASLRHHPGEAFLRQLCTACQERRFEGFDGQNLSNTLYALAVLQHKPAEAWLGGFLGRCREVGWRSMQLEEAQMTLWAMSVLRLGLDGGVAAELAARLRAADKEQPELVRDACTAVRQALYLEGERADADEALRELGRASDAAWAGVKHLVQQPRVSRLQREVCKVLREEGYEVKEEEVLPGSGLSVDFLLRRRGGGGGVAVEVDGSVHFFVNRSREATGTTVLKRRLLDMAMERGEVDAWVSVPWWVVYEDVNLRKRRDERVVREEVRRLVEGGLSGRQRAGGVKGRPGRRGKGAGRQQIGVGPGSGSQLKTGGM